MSSARLRKVAFIGTGIMGAAIAGHILDATVLMSADEMPPSTDSSSRSNRRELDRSPLTQPASSTAPDAMYLNLLSFI